MDKISWILTPNIEFLIKNITWEYIEAMDYLELETLLSLEITLVILLKFLIGHESILVYYSVHY